MLQDVSNPPKLKLVMLFNARNQTYCVCSRNVFQQLERNKFRLDLAQVPERELELLHTLAGAQRDEINPRHFIPAFQYAHFGRLTGKGLLIRTGRGRYKLYHPLCREFLRQTK